MLNELEEAQKNLVGKIEEQITDLGSMRRSKLMNEIDVFKSVVQDIRSDDRINAKAIRDDTDNARSIARKNLDQYDKEFQIACGNIDIAINELTSESPEKKLTIEDIRKEATGVMLESDLYILKEQKTLTNQIDKLTAMMSEQVREDRLLREISYMDTSRLLQFLKDAEHTLPDDDLLYNILSKDGKNIITKKASDDVATQYVSVLKRWESKRVPASIKEAKRLRGETDKIKSSWNLFLREIKQKFN